MIQKNEQTPLERAYRYLVATNRISSKRDIAEIMNASRSNVVSALKGNEKYNTRTFRLRFNSAFGNIFNEAFLETGEGEMLACARINNNVSSISTTVNRYGDAPEIERRWAPVVPQNVVRKPNFDIAGNLQKQMAEGDAETLYSGTLDIDMWHYIDTHALEPRYECGDCVGLKEVACDMLVPGDLYVVDTISRGLLTAYLYNNDGGGYIARVENPKYRDYYIPKDDVMRLYRMVIMFRHSS